MENTTTIEVKIISAPKNLRHPFLTEQGQQKIRQVMHVNGMRDTLENREMVTNDILESKVKDLLAPILGEKIGYLGNLCD